MKLGIKATLSAGSRVLDTFDHPVDTPDLDYHYSPIPDVDIEVYDNQKDGIVVKATAFGFLHFERTLVSPGEHDYHVAIGTVSLVGSITI